jgi:hypothetical protein
MQAQHSLQEVVLLVPGSYSRERHAVSYHSWYASYQSVVLRLLSRLHWSLATGVAADDQATQASGKLHIQRRARAVCQHAGYHSLQSPHPQHTVRPKDAHDNLAAAFLSSTLLSHENRTVLCQQRSSPQSMRRR